MLSSPGYQRSNRWRMFRLIALSLLAIGLLVAVIVALLPAPSKVHFVVWVVAEEYAFPLPPNSWAREDAARFGELTGILSVSDRSAPPGRVETSDDWSSAAAVANRLAEPLKRDRGRRRPAILYLSAHSAVRPGPRGPEACLIPPGLDDAKLLDDKHWLSAAELAKALAAHDALRNRVTVLVLDSGKLAPSWPLGIFEQSFPGALAANLEDLPRPEGGALWVLCSQDDQQVAWTSPALRGSAFGHYLAHGLSGAADAEGNDDLSVSAGELATYLKRHVDAWAQANRAARQSPRWITPGASPEELDATELVDVGGSPPILDSPPGGAAPDAHEELDAQWQAAQEIGSAAACFAPVAWQECVRRLLWTEQLLLAGPAYADARQVAIAENEHLLQSLKNLVKPPRAKPSSLAAWRSVDGGEAAQTAWRRWAGLALADDEVSGGDLQHEVAAYLTDTGAAERPMAEIVFASQMRRQLDPDTWADEPLVRQALKCVADRENLAYSLASSDDGSAIDGDPRPWAVVAESLAAHDTQRRQGLDALFVGADDERSQAKETLAAAQQSLDELATRGRRVASAYAIADRVWSEGPYVAAWHASRAATGRSVDLDAFSALAVDAAELDRQLYDLGPKATNFDEISRLADSVESKWQSLAAPLQEEWRELTPLVAGEAATSELQPARWRRIEAVLAAPMTPAGNRPRLRAELLALDAQLQAAFRESPPGPSSEAPSPTPVESAPARLWRSEGDSDDASEQGRQLRSRLLVRIEGRESWSARIAESASELSTPTASLSAALADTKLLESEREIRAVSALLPPGAGETLVERQMLLRAAARACDLATARITDFWGPPSDDAAIFFFQSAAGAEVALAGELLSDPRVRLNDAAIARLTPRERLSKAVETAKPPVLDLAGSKLEVARATITPVEIRVAPAALASIDVDGVWALRVLAPSAEGRRAVPLGSETTAPARDVGRAFSTGSSVAQRLSVRTADVETQGQPLAAAFFRGHIVEHYLGAPVALQRVITVRRPAPSDAHVRVDGRLRQRAQVVFVLDCSGSMNFEVAGDPRRRTRLDIAWDALYAVADELAKRGQYDVGLRKYAHRYNFSTTLNARGGYDIIDANGQPVADPAQQHPNRDSTVEFRLRRFRPADLEEFRDLKPDKGLGLTPLYYSILEALKNDFNLGGEEPKFLVVLTDGVDNIHPKADSAPLPEVARELKETGIQLHVVGFDLPDKEKAAWQTFQQFIAVNGGQTYDATDPKQLTDALNKALGLNDFTVADLADSSRAFTARLGQPATIPVDDCDPKRSWNATAESTGQALTSENFVVEGGEYLRLEIDDAQRGIVFSRYDGPEPMVGPDAATQGWRLGCTNDAPTSFLPAAADAASLFAWMQREDLAHDQPLFTPRPKFAWFEVTPVSNDGRAHAPYVFYDAPYLADTPVPIAQLNAPRWPADATKAQVAMWIRVEEPTPLLTQRLDRLSDDRVLPLEGIDGVRVTVEIDPPQGRTALVRVVEDWSAAEADFRPLAIALVPPPQEIRHSSGEGSRQTVHEFVYEGIDPQGWLAGKFLTVTPFSTIAKGAIKTPEPLVVPVRPPR